MEEKEVEEKRRRKRGREVKEAITRGQKEVEEKREEK